MNIWIWTEIKLLKAKLANKTIKLKWNPPDSTKTNLKLIQLKLELTLNSIHKIKQKLKLMLRNNKN